MDLQVLSPTPLLYQHWCLDTKRDTLKALEGTAKINKSNNIPPIVLTVPGGEDGESGSSDLWLW
jgi:hypothetical protein